MKFSCLTSHLQRALSFAERFVGKNVTLPVLGNILMEADDSGVVVTATNLEHALEIRVPCQVHKSGKVTVPARVMSSLVSAISEEKVDLEVKQGSLVMSSDMRQSRVNGIPPDDFPLIPKIKNKVSFSVPADILSRSLARILPAVSSSDFKPELCGAFMNAQQSTLTIAATDTFRLAEEQLVIAKGPTPPVSCIVPHRTVQEAARIFGDYGDESVEVSVGENQILARVGPVRITSRLIEGAFPEYRAIIPTQFGISVFMAREEFLSAVRSSGIFVSKLQEVTLNFSRGIVEVASANPEVGEYRTKIKINFSGQDTRISFNYRYLLDGIQAMDEEEIFFGCTDASAPALMRNKSRAAFAYVVMPIRLA